MTCDTDTHHSFLPGTCQVYLCAHPLKAITAISIVIEKQNNALEDHFGELSKRFDALQTEQHHCHVTMGTSPSNSGMDLFTQPLLPAFTASLILNRFNSVRGLLSPRQTCSQNKVNVWH